MVPVKGAGPLERKLSLWSKGRLRYGRLRGGRQTANGRTGGDLSGMRRPCFRLHARKRRTPAHLCARPLRVARRHQNLIFMIFSFFLAFSFTLAFSFRSTSPPAKFSIADDLSSTSGGSGSASES